MHIYMCVCVCVRARARVHLLQVVFSVLGQTSRMSSSVKTKKEINIKNCVEMRFFNFSLKNNSILIF
jgi:hypothetical protein